jgi:NACHT domain
MFSDKTVSVDDELAELRSWLEPVEHYEEDYRHNLSLRGQDTCDWAFSNSDKVGKTVLQWLNGRDQGHALLWLTGNPAQGKSVFAAYLIKNCKDKYGDCLFFFCRGDNEAKRSVTKVLQTIAFHLAEIEDSVRANYLAQKRRGINLTEMPYGLLWERLFRESLGSGLTKTVHCVLDGFDELRSDDRREFASLLADVTTFHSSIRVLVVSRLDREVEEAFGEAELPVKVVTINRKRTNQDIRRVVSERVEKKLHVLPSSSKERLVDALTKKAGGLFLWAKLALDIVCRKRLETAIFKALDDLPLGSEMRSLYAMIVKRIETECADEEENKLSKALLTWTFCSFRPLLVSELKFALELEFGPLIYFEKTIRDLSGSLITIGEDLFVSGIHATVREFFMSEYAGDFRVSEDIGNNLISASCLDYLSGRLGSLPVHLHPEENSSPEPDRVRLECPFIEYAAQYLFSHIKFSRPSAEFMIDLLSFLEGRYSLTWIEALATFGLVGVLLSASGIVGSLDHHDLEIEMTVQAFAQVTMDLERIALQTEENVTLYPRSIHVSLSSMFPQECVVAQNTRNDFATCIEPEILKWPSWRAFRAGTQSSVETKATACFTPCGEYLVFGQIPKNCVPVSVAIYQTQTYQPVIRLERFVFEEDRTVTKCFPLSDQYLFFETRCGSTSHFRVLVAFATGRAFVSGREIHSKCVLAEHTSKSLYQAGTWRQISFDIPVSPLAPRPRIALNPNGPQLLAWNHLKLLLWRHIGGRHVTIGFHSPIKVAEFAVLNDAVVILCVLSEGLRIYDLNAKSVFDIPFGFGPIDMAVIDPLSCKALTLYGPEKDRLKVIQVEFKSKRYSVSTYVPTNTDIRRHSGSLGPDNWSHVVWESYGRRILIRTETQPHIVYPHPINIESVVPSLGDHGFVVFDDLPDTILSTQTNQCSADPSINPEFSDWQTLIRKQTGSNRIWLHWNNFKISPCGRYIVVMGCNDRWHPEGHKKCESEPSRVGVIDRLIHPPSIWWPKEEPEGRADVAFDRDFNRFFIFRDLSRGFTVHLVNLTVERRARYIGIMLVDDVIIPPAIHAESPDKIYIACYSSSITLQIWKLDIGVRDPIIRLYRQFENTYVVSAVMYSSILIILSNSGWIGSLQVDNDIGDIKYHFWLPSHLSIPRGHGQGQCNLECTKDGLVTLKDIHGAQWQFRIDSLAQVLQSI